MTGVEKPNSVEDMDLCLAPSPPAADDEILSTTHGPRLLCGRDVKEMGYILLEDKVEEDPLIPFFRIGT